MVDARRALIFKRGWYLQCGLSLRTRIDLEGPSAVCSDALSSTAHCAAVIVVASSGLKGSLRPKRL